VSDIAVRVENLSKQYKIGSARRDERLKDFLAQGWGNLFRRGQPADNFWALRDVSFELKHGDVLGIIGRNGAGKSTLLKILSRITEPTSGRAEIYGRVGSLLEVGTGFDRELTGRENVYLNGAILGMTRREIDRKFDEIVDFSGVEKFIDTPVKRYSSGMHVRLAFAVAAHLEPEILIVDEVLAVGDASFQRKCLGKMENVAKEGRTVLFVSHNMAAVHSLCSRGLLLDGGKLSTEGAVNKVIEQYLQTVSDISYGLLAERTDRKGSGEIIFTGVSVLNDKRQPIDCAVSGQDVMIAVSYRSRDARPVSRLDVHVTFYTAMDQFMFNCSSEGSGYHFDELPSEGKLLCEIPRLPLAPGRYHFNLYSTIGGVIADWVQQAGFLEVEAGDFFGTGRLKTHDGGFLVDNRWIHDEA
jgi:homopolymeric O-antigen transport system ATP-binding protein